MMATRVIAPRIEDLPDEQLACRATRHLWLWDRLMAGLEVPDGLRVDALGRGVYQITDVCERCGKERVKTTLPHGIYDAGAQYRYRDPENWVRMRDAAPVDFKTEHLRRLAETLFIKASAA